MELIKNAISWGNSAGVLLPKEWKGKEVKVVLIDRSLQIKKEVFDILSNYSEDILGIYLIGSYARGEQTKRSDVDVLVITSKTNERIERGKYDFLVVSEDLVEEKFKKNILPLLPMLKEAKTLLNSSLIEKFKNTKITKRNLRFHIETTKSAMGVVKEFIELAKIDNRKITDRIAYSLVLRLRELYIVDCLIKNKMWNNKEFLSLVKKVSGSTEAYEGYLRSKDNEKTKRNLSINESERIYSYILKKIKEQEIWARKRK